ncbi:MAG: 4-demethylwyosine synthase TYW1 [Sulfolobales archaeon]|nr:4-demethylwyosine synthase TYW1 [Sulfolobales archaeon]MCX8186085.1 4-demethylwyosine synthase TYW1 [Sulfolobales archaeon]MDW7969380.1 4-demethylwyosine synthase TYW1 [Sulfolobales archaeon]
MQLTADVYTECVERLKGQKYHIIGMHSAVKKCLWVHNALVYGRFCYKCRFYGIESHRCVQMSPSVLWCWNSCLHCWRMRPQDVGTGSDDLTKLPGVDDPEFIADMAILEHRRTVSGYKNRTSKEMFREAMNPKHVAISLTGEPTLYPRLSELIAEFHKRGLSTFLVTRGVRPDVLASLREEPSQLYISLEAYDEGTYAHFNRPLIPKAWDLTLKTLEILPSFTSPTVIRITLVKGFNMDDKAVKSFKKLIEVSQPTYIETKAYMHVGRSINRLGRSSMPSFNEVMEFAKSLSNEVGYNIVSYSLASRVVLLTRLEKSIIRFGNGCTKGWEEAEECEEGLGEYEKPDEVI